MNRWLTWLSHAVWLTGLFYWLRRAGAVILRACVERKQPRSLTARYGGRWLVISGCTDGIGLALCKELRSRDPDLGFFLIGRNPDKLAATEAQLNGAATRTFTFNFSSTAWVNEELEKLKETLRKLHSAEGGVAILVNNVGQSYEYPMQLEDVSEETLDDMLFVNVRSAYRLTHILLPLFKAQRNGAIIFTGSGSSVVPASPLLTAYAGAKAAVATFAESLRVECANTGVVIQCHTPLIVASKMSKVRKTSFFVRSPESYARDAATLIERGSSNLWIRASMVPCLAHRLQVVGSWLLPLGVYNRMVYAMHAGIQTRALRKKTT